MRKAIWAAVVLVLIAVGVYFFNQYQASQEDPDETFIKPKLEYGEFVIYHISPDSTKANLHLLIDNPMMVGFTIDSFAYDVSIDDKRVFTSTYPDQVSLNAGDSSVISVPLTVFMDSLDMARKQAGEKGGEVDSVTYTLDAEFYTQLPLLEGEKFNINYDFRAPMMRSPGVAIKDWSFEGMEDGDAVVNLQVQIINYNLTEFHYKDIDYEVALGDQQRVVSGHKPGEIYVDKRDTGLVNLPLRINLSDAAGTAWDFITEGNNLNYRFDAKLKPVSESEMVDESELTILATGELEGLEGLVF